MRFSAITLLNNIEDKFNTVRNTKSKLQSALFWRKEIDTRAAASATADDCYEYVQVAEKHRDYFLGIKSKPHYTGFVA